MAEPMLPARLSHPDPPALLKALDAFEQELGGRSALIEILAHAPTTKDTAYVIGLLSDPSYADKSLRFVCQQGNVTVGDLWALVQTAALLRGQVKAALTIGEQIPVVVKDVMRRASQYEEPCEACEGTGSVPGRPTPECPEPDPVECRVCKGKGLVPHHAELDRQVVALKLGGLLHDGSKIQINNLNQAVAQPGSAGSLEELTRHADAVFEGTVVEPEDPTPDQPLDPDAVTD